MQTYATYSAISVKSAKKCFGERRANSPYRMFSQIPHINPLRGLRADFRPFPIPMATIGLKRAGDKNLRSFAI
jgi:hypothetical protein